MNIAKEREREGEGGREREVGREGGRERSVESCYRCNFKIMIFLDRFRES